MPSFAQSHPLSPHANILNVLWLLVMGIPPLVFGFYFATQCPNSLQHFNSWENGGTGEWWMPKLSVWENSCRFGAQHPLIMTNILLFVFMDVLFWVVSLVQGSTWMIDPYWTLIPLYLAGFYQIHPLSNGNSLRTAMVWFALLVWSVRLTYSYFRREEFQFGAREDWRFTELKQKFPRSWWWSSFFLAYVSQHIFLFGVSLPLYSAIADPTPRHVGIIDLLCFAISLFGIALAERSDTVLRKFMEANSLRESRGESKVLLLQEGPWAFSRHPNYVGEQIWWWGLGLLAWHQGTMDIVQRDRHKKCAARTFPVVVLTLVSCWLARRAAPVCSRSFVVPARPPPEFHLSRRRHSDGRRTYVTDASSTRRVQRLSKEGGCMDSVQETSGGA
jgi:steroid 5-alpha reductase family enzyme